MELTTQRLIIRSFELDDVPAYADIVADPEVMQYLGEPLDYIAAHDYVIDCIERDRAEGISRYASSRSWGLSG